MKQELFEAQHRPEWEAFDAWLAARRKKESKLPFAAHELPARYRTLCQHLSLARDRDYALDLVTYLHALAQAGHDILYRQHGGFGSALRTYVAGGFARDIRAHWRWVLAAFVLLYGPMALVQVAIHYSPDSVYLILSPEQVAQFESMYGDHTRALGNTAREASTDFQMFGFYIYNNISIAFRCFAGGLTAGILTVYALVFNGLFMGAIEQRLIDAGLGHNFYSFIAGHAAFEMTAILFSGAAGLKLAAAIIAPGQRSRRRALAENAQQVLGIVCGFTIMLVIAALIAAFWSPLRLDLPIKLGFGITMAVLMLLYFIFAGRDHES